MKKIVVEVDLHDEKQKQKAMSAVSGLTGIHSIAMNMKDKKLTVVGNVDPLDVVNKLKKYGNPKLLTVVTARNEEHGRKGKKKVEPTKAQKNPGKRPIVPQSTTISGFTKIFQSVALHDVPGTRGNKWELEAVAIKLKGSGNPPRIKRV